MPGDNRLKIIVVIVIDSACMAFIGLAATAMEHTSGTDFITPLIHPTALLGFAYHL